jgi:hypothetical protein
MANPQVAKQETDKAAERMVVVVINNRDGMEIVSMPHRGKDMHNRVMPGEEVIFMPGLNLVDAGKLSVLMKNPAFAAKFTDIIPHSLAPEQNPERVGKPILEKRGELPASRPLAKLPAEEAKALILEANEEQLPQFLKDEARDDVRLFIHERIRALNPDPIGSGDF